MLNVSGKKNQKPKNLWYGIFNGKRQVYYMYRYAHTKEQARVIFCREIARRQGVEDWIVLQYFKAGGDNYQITLEVEFTDE